MQEQEDESPGIPEWVVTFGDMMSLLLTFFIMMVSMSTIKEPEKFEVIIESLRRQFGHHRTIKDPVPGKEPPKNSRPRRVASMGRAKRLDLMRGGDETKAPQGDFSRVQIVDYGNRTVTGFNIDFLPASALLQSDEEALIDNNIEIFFGKPQLIEIRGHTSRRPLVSEGISNDHWKLAFQRCITTKAYLVEKGIDPERIRIALAGPNEPMFDTPDEIDRNDRVSIFLLDQTIDPDSNRP